MSTIRPIKTKKYIDPSNYVNTKTGEILSSETPGAEGVISEDTDMVEIHSDEYIIIDSKALDYILEHFTPVEYGRVLKMTNMVKGPFNTLYRSCNLPHTNQTLAEELDYTRAKYHTFMKKLYKKSIIYYFVGMNDGVEIRHILLNPHLARKRKTVSKECIQHFQNISETKALKPNPNV